MAGIQRQWNDTQTKKTTSKIDMAQNLKRALFNIALFLYISFLFQTKKVVFLKKKFLTGYILSFRCVVFSSQLEKKKEATYICWGQHATPSPYFLFYAENVGFKKNSTLLVIIKCKLGPFLEFEVKLFVSFHFDLKHKQGGFFLFKTYLLVFQLTSALVGLI